MAAEKPQVLVVTGMSGAGRSTTAKVLEDLGFRVVDNLPPSLIRNVVELTDVAEQRRRLAVVVDSRGGLPIEDLRQAIYHLSGQGIHTSLLFLDADDSALIRRYSENRRPHPVAGDTLAESIAAERGLLTELRATADIVVDTTDTNVHQLRERIEAEFEGLRAERPMRVSVTSFGFKHGAPRDLDLLFDVRFLPNPHWVPELRPLTGSDGAVAEYVLDNPDAREFVDRVENLLSFMIPRFRSEAKSYLSIGIGCTGGRHRSVALAEEIGGWLRSEGINANVRHRDAHR